jgi:alkylation response protein AidB-like acyl-CoA dehydrogenase
MTAIDRNEIREQLNHSVAAFAKGELGPSRARKMQQGNSGMEPAMWRQLSEMGWLGILVPEEFGGLGLGFQEVGVVAKGLSEALLTEPFSPVSVMAVETLVHGNNETLKRKLLPKLCAGDLVCAVAWQEKSGVLDPLSVAAKASTRGDGSQAPLLTASKRFVPGGCTMDGFIVSARSDGEIGLYWVDAADAGVQIQAKRQADGSEQAMVDFKEVRAIEVASPSTGGAILQRALNAVTIVAAAELLAVSGRLLLLTLEYLGLRRQFGKPIGSFQGIQHRAVDLHMLLSITGTVVQVALQALDEAKSGNELTALASRAKARSGDTAMRIAKESIQMHGAIGFTEDCDVGLYVKRILTLSASLGNSASHRARYSAVNPPPRIESERFGSSKHG